MKSILTNGGVTFIGIGYGEGEHSVRNTIEDAIHSPFLNGNDVFKSKRHIPNITIANEEGFSCLMMEDIHYIDDFQGPFHPQHGCAEAEYEVEGIVIHLILRYSFTYSTSAS